MRLKLKTLLWIVLLLFSACGKDDPKPNCEPYQAPAQLDVYSYPIVPGTPEWAELETGEQMVAVTQLPDSVLQNISTEGLVETCLNYPILSQISTRTILQRGVEEILGRFNGFQELSQREDAARALLERYGHMNPACYGGLATEIDMGKYTLNHAYLEAIFSQQTYLTKLSDKEKSQLMQLALSYYAEKKKHPDIYSIFNLKCSAIIMARLMLLEEYPPFLAAMQQDDYLKVFVEHIELQGRFETIEVVVGYANSF